MRCRPCRNGRMSARSRARQVPLARVCRQMRTPTPGQRLLGKRQLRPQTQLRLPTRLVFRRAGTAIDSSSVARTAVSSRTSSATLSSTSMAINQATIRPTLSSYGARAWGWKADWNGTSTTRWKGISRTPIAPCCVISTDASTARMHFSSPSGSSGCPSVRKRCDSMQFRTLSNVRWSTRSCPAEAPA